MEWIKKEIGHELVRNIKNTFGCDSLIAAILVRRGIIEGKDILFFLENNPRYLYNPFLFHSMEDAVDRIIAAKDEGEKVLIFGDRDVDGITSTSLLYEGLKLLGLNVTWQIPMGDDTYGLSKEAVQNHADNDGTLIITVDCGISNFKEIDFAIENNIDVIIVDHHSSHEELPNATVIVNPKIPDSGYPFKELSGCAVAWKLLLALRFSNTELYKNQICLLNIRPANESYVIEAVKLFNMVETDRIIETVVPGMIHFSDTRLECFLSSQQIFVWDAPLQTKLLGKAFGTGIEFNFFDFKTVVKKQFSQLGNLSLLRLKDKSTIGKYYKDRNTEIDTFENIFITFIQTSNQLFGTQEQKELQMVALSTLADLMPLENENRLLVRLGLSEMNKKPRVGISDLLAKQNLLNTVLGTHDLSWKITPIINASGRMGHPEVAIEMFTTENQTERNSKLNEIIQMNENRKLICEECWNTIQEQSFENFENYNRNMIVIYSDKIHRGVTGLIANKLVSTFKVPSIVICQMPNGIATASCRSAKGYYLLDILNPCSDIFLDFGGHAFAAGFSIEKKNIHELLNRLKAFSLNMEFTEISNIDSINIDAELPHDYLTPNLLELLDTLEPYGQEYPDLNFMAHNLKIENAIILGKTEPKHLKLTLDCGKYKWVAIYWKSAHLLNSEFEIGDNISAVFNISRNSFNGNITPQMTLLDVKKNI